MAGAVALIAFLVFLAGAWRPAWSIDEVITLSVVRRPLSDVWLTTTSDAALGPYYLLLDAWAHVSTTPIWLRLPSVTAMAASAAAIFWLATRMWNWRLGLVAATAFVLLPGVSRYAHEARPYALTLLACVLATACWYAHLEERRLSRAIGMCLWLVVAGFLHAFSLLVVLPWLATALLAPLTTRRRDFVATAVPALAAFGLLTPFLLHVAAYARGQLVAPEFSVLNASEELARLPTGVLSPPLAAACAGFALVLGAVGCYVSWRQSEIAKRVAVLAASWLALPPTVLTLVTIATDVNAMITRYWLFCLPGLAIAVAASLAWIGRRRLSLCVEAAVLLGVLALPTHLAIRGVDGHLGQRWEALPRVLDQPSLRDLPLLTEPWNFVGALAEQPTLAPSRLPLLTGVPIGGQILPERIGVESPQFESLASRARAIIVYSWVDQPMIGAPSTAPFPGFAAELAVYSSPLVLCDFFGAPLGVFAEPDAAEVDSAAMARQIESVAPAEISCRTDGG